MEKYHSSVSVQYILRVSDFPLSSIRSSDLYLWKRQHGYSSKMHSHFRRHKNKDQSASFYKAHLQSRPYLVGPPCPLSMLAQLAVFFCVTVNIELGDGGGRDNVYCQWEVDRQWFSTLAIWLACSFMLNQLWNTDTMSRLRISSLRGQGRFHFTRGISCKTFDRHQGQD